MSSTDSGSSSPDREPSRGEEPPEESGLRDSLNRSLVQFAPRPRGSSGNNHTMVGAPADFAPTLPFDFRALFVGAYPAIRAIGRARTEVGVALFAVDRLTGRLAGSMALAGRPGRVLGATVGRHDEADLQLTEDAWLANRQLAVLVHPLKSWEPDRVRYALLDLRTHHPMLDEHGRALASVLVEGPFVGRVGRYALFVLPTGDATDFPERGLDAWEQLPERVLLDRRDAGDDPAREAKLIAKEALRRAQKRGLRESIITAVGPLLAPDDRLRSPDEQPVAELTLRTADASTTVRIGDRALARGILLGRYPRCDGSGVLRDEKVSRAHLLIRRVEDQIVALDTGSTNGTECLAPELLRGSVRVIPLGDHAHLHLAEIADVIWRRV